MHGATMRIFHVVSLSQISLPQLKYFPFLSSKLHDHIMQSSINLSGDTAWATSIVKLLPYHICLHVIYVSNVYALQLTGMRFWKWLWIHWFRQRRKTSWLAERLLASKERLCVIEFVFISLSSDIANDTSERKYKLPERICKALNGACEKRGQAYKIVVLQSTITPMKMGHTRQHPSSMQTNHMKIPYKTRGCTEFGRRPNFVQSYTYNQEAVEKVTCDKGRRISLS